MEQMLVSDSLKTPQWLNGRHFQRRLYQALNRTAERYRLDTFIYPTVCRQPTSLEKMPPDSAPEHLRLSSYQLSNR